MAGFYIYETETLSIHLKKEDVLQDVKHIIVSIVQKESNARINKKDDELSLDIENSIINVSLSQQETSKFQEGKAFIQVNIYYNNLERDVSSKGILEVRDNLYRRVITDE